MPDNATVSGLSPKQLRAIEALLREPSVRSAAAELGINEATLWRWLQEPVFTKAYREAQARVFESALGSLQAATGEAVETLRAVMKAGVRKDGDQVRVTAARAVLDYSMKAVELIEIETRLQALEARLTA